MTDQKKVHLIAETAGIGPDRIIPLGRGATSAAWQITSGHDAFSIRMISAGTTRPVTYQSEFTILRMLRAAGCPMPEPVMSSVEMVAPPVGVPDPWAVTRVIPGEAIQKTPLLPGIAHELGCVLSTMHALPVTNFGRLVEQPHGLIGQQATHLAGMRARWRWATLWPFDGSELGHHPLTQLRPHVLRRLQALEAILVETVMDEPVALNHSDLHGEHIFAVDGSLMGIIDFGAAFIGAPVGILR